jgi:hypothetical protein
MNRAKNKNKNPFHICYQGWQFCPNLKHHNLGALVVVYIFESHNAYNFIILTCNNNKIIKVDTN